MNRNEKSNLHAFTSSYQGIVSELRNVVFINQSFDSYDPDSILSHESKIEYSAVWDTGANGSVISQKVVDDCHLEPYRALRVSTVGGWLHTEIYRISLFLPNNIVIPKLEVVRGILSNEDILIGMDIISCGDFAITNLENKTTMTFRLPSSERLDFTRSYPAGYKKQKTGVNERCPCGSGKKYKKCCKTLDES